ncbi:MAG: S8 family serine peptidase, partial [bacterium]|nr:S8 family serine peptidase [bacterium]
MPDFTNRVHAAFAIARSATDDWSDQNGHGTHTAGSIFGNGSAWSNGLFRGVAYEAQLVHQSIGDNSGMLYPPSDLNVLFIQAYTNGARIHSDSWGGGENGEYNAMSQDVDEFMWQHPDMLVVFSAGNGAGDYNADGRIDPDSIDPPATAKNLLAVGAAESQRPPGAGGLASAMYGDLNSWRGLFPAQVNTDFISHSADGVHQGIAAFSGRGPTDDGRTKPDLVAPGMNIISCRSHMPQAGTLWGTGYGALYNAASNDYTFSGGTSMAAPLVAGAAALVRQYFAERHLPAITNPSAALLKATLINGARSLTPGQYGYGATREIPPAPRPNNVEGWGQVDLAATLTNLTVYATNTLATGASATFTIGLTDTNMVSVCLAWTDYPAAPGAGKKLVNDLDLRLITPAGATLYPNGGTAPDRLNNVETIDIPALPPGISTLYVTAYTVPQGGRQPYALVIRSAAAN